MLGCGLVALSLIAVYVRATVLNTDRYVDTMAPIAESPAVQQAVADKLDRAITSRVDFAALLREALPDRGTRSPRRWPRGAQQAIRSRLDAFVASDDFQSFGWRRTGARTRASWRCSRPASRARSLEGDTVYLDFGRPSTAYGRPRASAGWTGSPRDPGERRRPRRAPAIGGLRQGARGHRPDPALAIVLPILALLCLAGHVALSRPRRRGLLRVGLGLVVTALLMLAVVGIGRTVYLDAIDQDVLPRQAAADIFDALIDLLRTGVRVVAIAAVVMALLALVLGRPDGGARAAAHERSGGWVAAHRYQAAVGWVAGHRGTRPDRPRS